MSVPVCDHHETLTEYIDSFHQSDCKLLGIAHNKRNREQRIRISTYQKLCILQSDRLKFLFSVLYSLFFFAPYILVPRFLFPSPLSQRYTLYACAKKRTHMDRAE